MCDTGAVFGGAVGGTIFICYRRGDMAAAGRLYDRLAHTFGPQQLFMDVDNIPPGEDFVAVLEAQVAACDVLLALIGRDWLTATDKAGYRRFFLVAYPIQTTTTIMYTGV